MHNLFKPLILISILFAVTVAFAESGKSAADTPFIQEYHEPYKIGEKDGMNDVRAIAVDRDGRVWAGTTAGIFLMEKGKKQWRGLMSESDAGPVFAVIVDSSGAVWIGAWNGIYRATSRGLEKAKGIDEPIAALCATKHEIIGLGPDGLWRFVNGTWTYGIIPCSKAIRSVLPDSKRGFWIATGMGLYHQTASGYTLYQNQKELLSANVTDIDYATDGSLWVGGLGGITVYKAGKRAGQFIPKDGLPTAYVQSVTRAPDGRMWIGTKSGLARYDGKSWSLRHSKRWLIADDVRDVAFDAEGTAWIATRNGVSAIKRKSMRLADKADHYLRICLTRHVRPPYLVEKCRLTVPGDTSIWQPRDNDNDGQYTGMYLAMESFRYAATKDPAARENAKKAFQAMKFLQTVTETNGFVARTVIPGTWTRMADPNRKFSEQQWAAMRVDDPREKRVEKRWRRSRKGKWLWKGDTSSDEITGHLFGYLFYYDLAADYAQREQVREHVCKIMNYIIDNGYVLKDIDGSHTQWAVWSPEKLNHDPDWAAERGINSVEILSYLKFAYHITGNERYQNQYLYLLNEQNYAANVRRSKTTNPSWRTHIDDELLALAYPCLLLYEKDPDLHQLYRASLDQWYAEVKKDNSPFFNFIYAACVGRDPQLNSSFDYLRAVSLDLVRWKIDNSQREDLQLVRVPELEALQTSRRLPPDEQGMFRWDDNPWKAIQGDGGYTESDGVFWLLPYWMGRYYGLIEP